MELQLDLKPKGYSVFLGRGDFSHLSRFTNLNGKILILTDDGVPEEHVRTVMEQCANAAVMTVQHGEGAKSFPVFEDVCRKLLALKFGRRDLLIAVAAVLSAIWAVSRPPAICGAFVSSICRPRACRRLIRASAEKRRSIWTA